MVCDSNHSELKIDAMRLESEVHFMSLSVHFNAYNQKTLTGGVQAHQERFSEREALHALKNTKSHIDPSETQYNVSLYRDEVLETKTVKRVAKELTDQFQANREKAGLKRKRKDFNTMMVGTFQISDLSLVLMGYDKSKKWSENSEKARRRVTNVYQKMVKNALDKPDYYGRVMTATMHVDESTPHVDFMCIGVDPEKPHLSVREILNGEETKDPETGKRRYMPKGAKLSEIQDDLSTIYERRPEIAKKYNLVRGEEESVNLANIRDLRSQIDYLAGYEVKLEDREDELDKKEKRLTEKELKLASKESEIDSRELQLKETEKHLDDTKEQLYDKELKLDIRAAKLSRFADKYAELKANNERLEKAYSTEKRRRVRLEAEYEYDSNNVEHALYKREQLQQNKKTPQKPRQQTKDNGYGL